MKNSPFFLLSGLTIEEGKISRCVCRCLEEEIIAITSFSRVMAKEWAIFPSSCTSLFRSPWNAMGVRTLFTWCFLWRQEQSDNSYYTKGKERREGRPDQHSYTKKLRHELLKVFGSSSRGNRRYSFLNGFLHAFYPRMCHLTKLSSLSYLFQDN